MAREAEVLQMMPVGKWAHIPPPAAQHWAAVAGLFAKGKVLRRPAPLADSPYRWEFLRVA